MAKVLIHTKVKEQVDYLVKIGVSDTGGAHLRNVLKSNVFISKFKTPLRSKEWE